MCAPCAVIINCCAAVGSSARALATASPSIAPSAEALASSNEELKEAFMLMYEHRTISAKDMALVLANGKETRAFAARCDAFRFGKIEPMPSEAEFVQECEALRWKGIDLFIEIAERTPEYAGPKKPQKLASVPSPSSRRKPGRAGKKVRAA